MKRHDPAGRLSIGTIALLLMALSAWLQGCASAVHNGGNGGGGTQIPLSIATSTLPGGQVGASYSASLVGTGGTLPYSWQLMSGTLPAGLSLNSTTGAIGGTPTAAANGVSLTFQLSDSEVPAQTKTVTLILTVSPATLSITTSSLPNGQVGAAYTTTLLATGGSAPYTWSLSSGTMPAGLSLNAGSGVISGTPTAAGGAALTFKVSDSANPAQTQMVTLTLSVAPSTLGITTTSLPNGQVGAAYSASLTGSGGVAPYHWTLKSGGLPAGLSLNASTGAITGTPTVTANATSLTFQVTDSGSPSQTQSVTLTLTIKPATLAITTSSLPSGQVGSAYSATLAANGGTQPYTWSLTSGALPSGLSLDVTTGVISGTPTASASATSLTFKVTDSGSPAQSQSVTLSLTIAPASSGPLMITTTSLPSGQAGTAYSTTLAASGGKTPYTWSLTSGTLPAGLSLNTSTGAISGTPSAAANASLTFQVTDSSAPAQSQSVTLSLVIAPAALSITTTSLPSGQVGTAYTATLAANGGTSPFTWTLTSGTLPAGLSLNAATGAISGTPTATANSTPLTFQVKDSGSPQQSKTVSLTLTITGAASISVAISPKRAGLTVTQTLAVTATVTNDSFNQGVTWSATGSNCTGSACGTFTPSSSASGAAASFQAPSAAGVYTITATSVTDTTKAASITIGVTDLPGVTTWHNDLSRDGVNAQEYALTTANVATATFGKLFSCSVDAAIYAQPLWVANLSIQGAQHNVILVATQHDTVYAFDADAKPCTMLWTKSLLGNGETYLSSGDVNTGDISPDIGIVSTPVIDLTTNTIYVVSKTKNSGTGTFYQRLHAMSLINGAEQANSPAVIASGDSNSFALIQNQRSGLVLNGSTIYVTWASHGDNGPYHGYIYSFDKTSLAQLNTFNDTPGGSQGGIWMAGAAPAVDTSGNLYFITGNGSFDASTANYGDSFVKLTSTLGVSDYFTPSDQQADETGDVDFGSGGAAILVNAGPSAHLAVGGGKDSTLYVLDRDNMGHFGDSNALQSFSVGNSIFSTAAFWQNNLYIAPAGGSLTMYPLNLSTSKFGSASFSAPSNFGWPGSTPSISSQGAANGLVWCIETGTIATLGAYDATNVSHELWNSNQASGNRDRAGGYVKFTVPTVANGKVYLGASSEVDVYGLLPN